MFIILLPLISAYVLNKDELKVFHSLIQIFDHTLPDAHQYDLQVSKAIEHVAGKLDEGTTIVALASQYQPFNQNQNIALLTTNENSKNKNIVYTIQYNKLQLNAFTINSKSFDSSCNSIAYISDEYILSCGSQLLMQNGTIVALNTLQNVESIYFVDGCLVAIEKGKIIVFEESNQFVYNVDFIDILITQLQFYILTSSNIVILDAQNQTEFIEHQCTIPPTSFAVFDNYIYVQCGTLRKIYNDGKILELKSIQAKTLSQTKRYLIVDNRQVYNIEIDEGFYTADTDIYSFNYDDQVLNVQNLAINIISLLDVTIIQGNISQQFTINDLQFIVVDFGLQKLNFTQQKLQAQIAYSYQDFISGNDIKATNNASDIPPIKVNIQNSLENQKLYSEFNYNNDQLILLYSQNDTLFAVLCDVTITDTIESNCKQSEIIATNLTKAIDYITGVYDRSTDQIIICFQQGEDQTIYLNGEIYRQLNSKTQFSLSQNLLLQYSSTELIIYRLAEDVYNIDITLQIPIELKTVAISDDSIYLIDNNNQFSILQYSINGWSLVYEETLATDILKCFYINQQLFLISENTIQIYKARILRGTVPIDILGKKEFLETQNFLYISNGTHIYQISTNQELSLSSLILRVIQYNSNFIAASLKDYELLIIDNKELTAFQNKPMFTPNGLIGSYEEYFKVSSELISFSNSFNETLKIAIPVTATQLRLQSNCHSERYQTRYINGVAEIPNLFLGPITNQSLSNPAIIFQQPIYSNMEPIFPTRKVIDLIYIGNKQTIVFSQQQLLLCEVQCKVLKTIDDISCHKLYKDQIAIYLICQSQIIYVNKTDFQTFSDANISFLHPLVYRFDHLRMGVIVSQENSTRILEIYNNFQFKAKKNIPNIVDFCFHGSNVFILTTKNFLIASLDLTVTETIDVFTLITRDKQSTLFPATEFRQMVSTNNQTFILSTNNALIYKLHIDSNRISQQFVRVPSASPLEMQMLLNGQILAVSYLVKNQVISAFYLQINELVPYFQTVKLKHKISETYIRQLSENSFVIRNTDNHTQLIEFVIQPNTKIFINETIEVELRASDFEYQNASQILNLVVELSTDEENYDYDQNASIWIVYILGGIIVLLIILFLFRYTRRYLIMKRSSEMKFVDDKQSPEIKNESS